MSASLMPPIPSTKVSCVRVTKVSDIHHLRDQRKTSQTHPKTCAAFCRSQRNPSHAISASASAQRLTFHSLWRPDSANLPFLGLVLRRRPGVKRSDRLKGKPRLFLSFSASLRPQFTMLTKSIGIVHKHANVLSPVVIETLQESPRSIETIPSSSML